MEFRPSPNRLALRQPAGGKGNPFADGPDSPGRIPGLVYEEALRYPLGLSLIHSDYLLDGCRVFWALVIPDFTRELREAEGDSRARTDSSHGCGVDGGEREFCGYGLDDEVGPEPDIGGHLGLDVWRLDMALVGLQKLRELLQVLIREPSSYL